MNYMVHSTDIVAYTFNADTYCPQCIGKMFGDDAAQTAGGFLGMPNDMAEKILDQAADDMDIDRYDEYSYDSGDFPKVVFASQVEDVENCGNCRQEI